MSAGVSLCQNRKTFSDFFFSISENLLSSFHRITYFYRQKYFAWTYISAYLRTLKLFSLRKLHPKEVPFTNQLVICALLLSII